MDASLLKQVIREQNKIELPSKLYERSVFDQISLLKKNRETIVITGIRRCGKSTVLQLLRKQSKESDYFLNFDDDRLIQFAVEDFQMLFEFFIEFYDIQKTFYFDEIQNIPGWERFIRRLRDQGNKVYLTGSNATLFSRELGTRLTGRYIQIEMYPYSFWEFVNHNEPELIFEKNFTTEQKGKIKRLFSKYLNIGGIPEYVHLGQKDYLFSLYEGVIYRDIISRYHLSSEKSIKELVYYLCSQIGKEFSYNGMRKILGLAGVSTVSDYCGYLEESYLCSVVNRYSHSLKKQILSSKKCYFVDHALAKYIGFRPSKDRGRLLENLVFMELKRRENEVYYHFERKECDFILRRQGKIKCVVQVCLTLLEPNTKTREIEGLLDALEIYSLNKGLILTEDEEEIIEIKKDRKKYQIQILPIWKWLLT